MAEIGKLTFTKKEIVSGKTRIEKIFASGRAFLIYPFRVVYLEYDVNDNVAPSLLISIPKKRLKRATDRNRMKRLAREAYRLNKGRLILDNIPEGVGVDIAVIYVADKLLPYYMVEKSIIRALQEISKRINSSQANI